MGDDVERRKPGRPKADQPKSRVSAWIPEQEHDRLIRLANRREQSVSRTLGEILRQRLNGGLNR